MSTISSCSIIDCPLVVKSLIPQPYYFYFHAVLLKGGVKLQVRLKPWASAAPLCLGHTLCQLSYWGAQGGDIFIRKERSPMTDLMCLNKPNKRMVFVFMTISTIQCIWYGLIWPDWENVGLLMRMQDKMTFSFICPQSAFLRGTVFKDSHFSGQSFATESTRYF